jgi:aryl carrier-like protein
VLTGSLAARLEKLSPAKRRLLARYLEEESYDPSWLCEAAVEPPQSPVEEELMAIWKEVLGLTEVGREANFFDLGGDSILSIRIVAKAYNRGIRLSSRQLFEHPTLSALAQIAEVVSGEEPAASLATDGEAERFRTSRRELAPEDFPEAELSEQDLASILARVVEQVEASSAHSARFRSPAIGGGLRFAGHLPRAVALR